MGKYWVLGSVRAERLTYQKRPAGTRHDSAVNDDHCEDPCGVPVPWSEDPDPSVLSRLTASSQMPRAICTRNEAETIRSKTYLGAKRVQPEWLAYVKTGSDLLASWPPDTQGGKMMGRVVPSDSASLRWIARGCQDRSWNADWDGHPLGCGHSSCWAPPPPPPLHRPCSHVRRGLHPRPHGI